MSIIRTNILSQVSQRNLGNSVSSLERSTVRLSTGLRINTAADDMVGSAVSNRMTSQINGLAQAKINANYGISVAQTVEGALGRMGDNLQRVRELTVQAAGQMNSGDDLKSIQREIDQRLDDIQKMSSQVNYNGMEVLGADQAMRFQIGSDDSDVINLDLKELNSTTLGIEAFNVSGPKGLPVEITNLEDAFGKGTQVQNVSLASTADGLAQELGIFGGADTGITFDNDSLFQDEDGAVFAQVQVTSENADETAALKEQGIDVPAGTTQTLWMRVDPTRAEVTGNTANIDLKFDSAEALDLRVPRDEEPISKIDNSMEEVISYRSEIGAFMNRLDSALNNIETSKVNLEASRSQIMDANYADEVAELTRSQITQQAGNTVLAQANQLPEAMLSLLG